MNGGIQPERVLIVDGYNVLRSSSAYQGLSQEDFACGPALNAAREKLLADVATYALSDYDATIVFDGGGNPESTGVARRISGVNVVFSPAGVEADQVIEKLAYQAHTKGREVVVVTSDSQMQWTMLGCDVTRMSSADFAREVATVNDSWRERNPSPKVKTTLGERIDPDIKRRLTLMIRPK